MTAERATIATVAAAAAAAAVGMAVARAAETEAGALAADITSGQDEIIAKTPEAETAAVEASVEGAREMLALPVVWTVGAEAELAAVEAVVLLLQRLQGAVRH